MVNWVTDRVTEWAINRLGSRRYSPDPPLGIPDEDLPYPKPREFNLQHRFSGYPIRMAHVSDLHFGKHSQAKLSALKTFLNSGHFHILVITGDIVDYPRPDYFDQAYQFLQGIDIEQDCRVVAPGNHDRHGRQSLEDFRQGLHIEICPHSCSLYQFSPEDALIVFVFNSTVAEQSRFIQVRGFVDSQQLEWFDRTIEHLQRHRQSLFQSSAKMAVLHHHVIPVRDSKNEKWLLLENGGQFLDKLASAGIELLLHGHKHCPMVSHLSFGRPDRDMLIISGGTASEKSDETEREEEQKRVSETTSVHTLEIYQQRYTVSTHKFVNALPFAEKFKRTAIFRAPRRGRLYGHFERRIEYTIVGPDGDLKVTETKRFRVSRQGSGQIRNIRFSAGNTVKSPIEALGINLERKQQDGTWMPIDRNSVAIRTEEDEISVIHFIEIPLDPPPVYRDFLEEVRLQYTWPKGYVELVRNDVDENTLGVFQDTDILEFKIELVGERKLGHYSFIPKPTRVIGESESHVEVRFEGLHEDYLWYRLETQLPRAA